MALSLALATSLSAQNAKPAASPSDLSYALGMLLGSNLKASGLSYDLGEVQAGLRDTANGAATRLTEAQAQTLIQTAYQAAQAKKGADNLSTGKAFLAKNAKKAGVKVTASGLQYEVVKLGTGPKPAATDTVKVHYEGTLIDGKVFDSSIARGQPATFPLNGVIRGWTEGLQLMPVGSKYKLYVPSELGYGERGAGDSIGPNAVLVFDVELLSIETAKK